MSEELVVNFDFLPSLTIAGLGALQTAIGRELETRRAAAVAQAAEEIRRIAADAGIDLSEVPNWAGNGKRGSGGDKRLKVAAKYKNPESPDQTWSGRGKRPHWIKDAIEAGRALEEFRA